MRRLHHLVVASMALASIDTVGVGKGDHPWFNNLVGALYFGYRNASIQNSCNAAVGVPAALFP